MTKPKKSIFAINIAKRRRALGWSQAELADRAGYHRGLIAQMEGGKIEGSAHSREVIAETLMCSVGDLYADPEKPHNDRIRLLAAADIIKAILVRSDVLPVVQAAVLALVCPDSYLEVLTLERQGLLIEFVQGLHKPR